MNRITLGEHELDVVPQRHSYLQNRLGRFLEALVASGQELNGQNLYVFLGGRVYEALCALIPQVAKRMPGWEFAGYASQEAMDAGDYDEDLARDPSVPEIVNAFETAIRVNRLDVLRHIFGVLDPNLLRATVNAKVAEALSMSSASTTSPSSLSASDGSGPSTSSGTTDPTSTASTA